MNPDRTFVTKPFLPPLDEFIPYLEEIWETGILTNDGPFHQRLEKGLCQYLGVEYISLFTNGTIALLTALKSLNVRGEVITTPFSFVATSHSLLWSGVTPVFVDIQANSLNIDPKRIEDAITPRTSAILAVHCYGHPCDVDEIQTIADKHNLKVIYDAAHAFGVKCHCGSILNHGNLSVLSLHATKVFNTFEGGAIISPDQKTKTLIDQLRSFGHEGETTVNVTGINGKMSEVNAAFGLLQLKYIDQAIEMRKEIDRAYRKSLSEIKGIHCIANNKELAANFSYFPVLVDKEYPMSRDQLYEKMKEFGIHPRRYFYPLISEFTMYRDLPSANPANLQEANHAASRVLCLPIYPDLSIAKVDEICAIIKGQ